MPRRPYPLYIIWSPVPILNSLGVSVAVLELFFLQIRYAVTMNFDPVTFTNDRFPWTYVVDRLRHGQTLYEIWAKSDNPRRSYCSLSIWPYDLEHVSRVALCFGIVFTKFKLSQATRVWNVTIFFMLIRPITLWPWCFSPWPWTCVTDGASFGQSTFQIWTWSVDRSWVIDD